ncbi:MULTISPECIES: high-potential iron-sulfur protein [Photobacterium]|uniref:High-potential iron-sulfur protein n=1 Tax=Photobacterium halotolerans TaxID=265726 RepID=A0A0F5VAT1_9GAMM|nr:MULTISPECIES: high-potential iron-sulfur protein [Photobacterium]KKC99228.1 high-potential iron sulfur protein 2 [Photobacterium halotolerans]UIP26648.1 high-potential iron-sulfur protein [Photobacterium sp. TLY01]
MKTSTDRRRFLRLTMAGIIGITLGDQILQRKALASEELPHLAEDDAQASALQYTHKSPHEENHCGNCMLLQGNEGDEWRPCSIFPGKAVNVNGWCSAWTAKPA